MELAVFYALYIALACVSCVAVIYEKQTGIDVKKKMIFIFMVLLALLMALRPQDVPDTAAYMKFYAMDINLGGLFARGVSIGDRFNGVEYMFFVLMAGFKTIGASVRVFFFVVALFISFMIFRGLESAAKYVIRIKEDYDGKSMSGVPLFTIWAAFMIFFGLLYTGVAIRAGISMALGMMAVKVFLDRKSWLRYVAAFVIIIIAALLQTFGMIYLPIIIALRLNLRMNKKVFAIFWVILIGLFIFQFGGRFVTSIFNAIDFGRSLMSIDSFGSYISDDSALVRKKDIYRIIVYGAMVLVPMSQNNAIKRYAFLVICGIAVMAILYPVAAVYRIADYFLMFAIPIIAMAIYERRFFASKDWLVLVLAFAAFPIQLIIVIQG